MVDPAEFFFLPKFVRINLDNLKFAVTAASIYLAVLGNQSIAGHALAVDVLPNILQMKILGAIYWRILKSQIKYNPKNFKGWWRG